MAQASATSIIASQAFRYLKLAPISSFADDSDKARDAAQLYPVALRACLERADWSFASVVVALPEATPTDLQAADAMMPYSYQLPGDFVAMRAVGDGETRWRIDRAELLRADISGPLRVRYTSFIDQEAKLPAAFRMAVAAQLACYLAPLHAEATSHVEWIDAQLSAQMSLALRADRTSSSPQRYDNDAAPTYWADEVTQ